MTAPDGSVSIDALPALVSQHRKVWVVYMGSTLDAHILATLHTWAEASVGRGRTIVWVDGSVPFTTRDPRVTAFRIPQLRYFRKGQLRRKVIGLTEMRSYVAKRMTLWGYGARA